MKRNIIFFLIVLICVQLLGCEYNPKIEDKERLTGDEYINTDFSIYSKEEIEIRSTFEFLNIYLDSLKNKTINKEENENKYGINNFWRMNDFIHFNSMEDMATVLSNKDFQEDFFKKNSIPIIINYYLPSGMEPRFNAIGLLAKDGKRYFDILGMGTTGDEYKQWGVYDIQGRKTLKEILSFYAALDDLTMNSVKTNNGYTVYYFPYEDSTLFCAIGFPYTDKPYTAYIWEQEGVIGVLILSGEYSSENLDLCVLEKHDL